MHAFDSTTTVHLASTSPARLRLLRTCGIEPVVDPSSVDEDALVAEAERRAPLTTQAMVELLARAKAAAVVDACAGGIVIGSDSNFEFEGVRYGKPHTAARARERLHLLSGRTGTLWTGQCIIDCRDPVHLRTAAATDSAEVSFGTLSDTEIEGYIATGEPLEVAGAFTLDGFAAPFITAVSGAPSCVIGLSLPALRSVAAELGIAWPDLWNRGTAIL